MSGQFGVVNLSGQYGNTRLVIDRGKGRAHLSQVVSKDRIMKDAAFEATRENMKELGASGLAGKSLRKCLTARHQSFGERFMTARMNGVLRRILNRGSGPGGQRTFEMFGNESLLMGFELNRQDRFESRFQANYDVTANVDFNTVTFDVPVLDTRMDLKKPQGANHFKMILTVGMLSDYLFDVDENKHVPFDASLDGLHAFAETAVLPLSGSGAPTSLQLTAAIPGLPVLPTGVSLVVGIGIEFIRQINGANTLLGRGNAMKIDTVFVV